MLAPVGGRRRAGRAELLVAGVTMAVLATLLVAAGAAGLWKLTVVAVVSFGAMV